MTDDAERLLHAIARQRHAARRLTRGTIDEAAAREYYAASWDEALALCALDGAPPGLSQRNASRSRRA